MGRGEDDSALRRDGFEICPWLSGIGMKATLEVINRMQADGVIGKYAIGGAVGATFYLEASAQAIETEVQELPTRVITAEHLVALALRTARAKDFARILQFVEAGVLNADRLDQILKRHGLLEKWEQFGVKFFRGNP